MTRHMDHGLAEIGQYYELINERVIVPRPVPLLRARGSGTQSGEALAAAHVRPHHEGNMTGGAA